MISTVTTWSDRITERYIRFSTPTASGLPNWRVVAWFPVLAALGVLVLVVLHISGTSSGAHWVLLGTGEDPRLIAGTPRGIRSDEWLVQQSWVVSQSNTGYGDINPTFPGGSDMVLLNELPSWHWSSLFRPHLWGYLLFGLDAGVAWHWWVPALALVSGTYLFVVTMLPRRPLTAAFFAVGIYFTPLLQWFYTPSSVWPVAWTMIALAGTVWILVDPRRWVRVTWSAVIGYFAVTMAMGLYVPFMLPGVYVFIAFALGYTLRARPWTDGGARSFLGRIAPFVAAGVAAAVVTVIWVASRWQAVDAIASTTYPGQRTLKTGALIAQDPFLTGLAGAPWSQALRTQGANLLGGNSSEASTVILLAVFLLPGLAWFAIRSFRAGATRDWLVVCLLGLLVVVAAYLFIPGWDAIAHVLQFDRVPPERFRIMFAVLLPVFAVLVIDHIDRHPTERSWKPGLLSAVVTTAVMVALLIVIVVNDPGILAAAPTWVFTVPAIIAATFLLFVRRGVAVAAGLLMVTAVVLTALVNPIYRGIYDLSETEIGKEVTRIDAANDGDWVGIGSYEPRAILTQTGVGSFTGVQNYPSPEMWEAIDPDGEYEHLWNRLAHVTWTLGKGEPVVTSPSGDVLTVTFDACSVFAQENVDYVLVDGIEIDSDCVDELVDQKQGVLEMRVYEVVPPR